MRERLLVLGAALLLPACFLDWDQLDPALCNPGDTRCASDGYAVEACDPQGDGWHTTGSCYGMQRCTVIANEAACRYTFCSAGQFYCSEGQRYQCNGDGTQGNPVPCAEGGACTGEGVCSTVVSCGDGVKNGSESDVDCGGGECGRCGNGSTCRKTTDCQSNSCVSGVCKAASGTSCSNGIRDGRETDVDCGGGTCPQCDLGKVCNAATDCQSGVCTSNQCVPAQLDASCTLSNTCPTDGGGDPPGTSCTKAAGCAPVCCDCSGLGASKYCVVRVCAVVCQNEANICPSIAGFYSFCR